MTILFAVLAALFQGLALKTGAEAIHENSLWAPDKTRRNRLAFACLVFSVLGFLTAYSVGVRVSGC